MARFTRLEVIQYILSEGLLPLFYHQDLAVAEAIVDALVEGGIRVVEFTNRGEAAYPVFSQLLAQLKRKNSPAILGVGSIVDAPTAALFIAASANFIVGSSFNPEIARLCNRRKILYIPGCATATEISTAEEYGAEICKVFPGETIGGPAFIKAVMAPCPWHRLMPTGGVDATQGNVETWIKHGAAAVGMGSKLIRKDLVDSKNYAQITDLTKACLSWIKQAQTTNK